MSGYDLVSLGEMMLCLSAPKYGRLRQADRLNVRVCGAQFNIAANMASLGHASAFLSALPANELGYLARAIGAGLGVDMSHVPMIEGARMGLIFLEHGLEPRRHTHLYDRGGSAASMMTGTTFDWSSLLEGSKLAYCDGIIPALNQGCRAAALEFLNAAREAGCLSCFDINYRHSLWGPDSAQEFYRAVLPAVDVLVTSRTFSEQFFNYSGSDAAVLEAYRRDFGCDIVCMTYRGLKGMARGSWRSVALHNDALLEGRAFDFEIVDRFGTGDAFFAGLLHGVLQGDVQYGLDFGAALCALAHTIDGDPALFSVAEVQALLDDDFSLRMTR